MGSVRATVKLELNRGVDATAPMTEPTFSGTASCTAPGNKMGAILAQCCC
jgi:hypothetical protein